MVFLCILHNVAIKGKWNIIQGVFERRGDGVGVVSLIEGVLITKVQS